MYKRSFQGLKGKFIHVSGLLPAYFDLKKTTYEKNCFFKQIMVGEDLRHS